MAYTVPPLRQCHCIPPTWKVLSHPSLEGADIIATLLSWNISVVGNQDWKPRIRMK
jgi:hypothetical protein